MPDLHITLFGLPHAERDGVPVTFRRHQTLALLAYLAATDQPHGRDALAALFWPSWTSRAFPLVNETDGSWEMVPAGHLLTRHASSSAPVLRPDIG